MSIFLSRMGKTGADKENDFKEIIVKYLTDQNRPYSVNDLVANLHNQIPKAGIFSVDSIAYLCFLIIQREISRIFLKDKFIKLYILQ